MAPAETVNVEAVYCTGPGACDLVKLSLPVASTVADAVAASGLCQRHGLQVEGLRYGVWSKPREAASMLRDGDRVEIYRPLQVDPKEARRQRYQQHKESQAQRLAAKAAAKTAATSAGQVTATTSAATTATTSATTTAFATAGVESSAKR